MGRSLHNYAIQITATVLRNYACLGKRAAHTATIFSATFHRPKKSNCILNEALIRAFRSKEELLLQLLLEGGTIRVKKEKNSLATVVAEVRKLYCSGSQNVGHGSISGRSQSRAVILKI